MTVLECRDLSSGYGGAVIVDSVSVEVRRGEVLALLGPNGAGKTTLLSTIAGFVKPQSGHIRLGGRDVTGMPPHRLAKLGLGLVPDDRALLRSLTVHESFRLARPAAIDPYELFPELVPLAGRKIGLLSGGEQQMVAVARAVSLDPAVLLIDELSLGLAPLVVRRLLAAIRRISEDRGTAVVLVEQHVQQALATASRAAFMVSGRIRLTGTPAELLDRPEIVADVYLAAGSTSPSTAASPSA